MTTVATHASSAYLQLDERADDANTVNRLKFWYNEARAVICEKCGIRGLQVEGDVYLTEGETYKELTITSDHNSKSVVVGVSKWWMIEYRYDIASASWVTTDTYFNLEEITYEEYRRLWVSERSTGIPSKVALFGQGDTGQPYAYLYPPPDSNDSTDDSGLRYRLYYIGEADIGDIDPQDALDILYPIGADHVYMSYLRYKQCEYDKDYVNKQMAKKEFEDVLRNFLAREHTHSGIYTFGRQIRKNTDNGVPAFTDPIVVP